jgi:ABC-type sugar transport system ATPase subunit
VGSWFDYTTLFNLITGHDVPDSGRIVFDGSNVAGPAPERVAAMGMARTFQHGRVFANMSVRDNVLVGAHTRLDLVRHAPRLIGPLTEPSLALDQPSSVTRNRRHWRDCPEIGGMPTRAIRSAGHVVGWGIADAVGFGAGWNRDRWPIDQREHHEVRSTRSS